MLRRPATAVSYLRAACSPSPRGSAGSGRAGGDSVPAVPPGLGRGLAACSCSRRRSARRRPWGGGGGRRRGRAPRHLTARDGAWRRPSWNRAARPRRCHFGSGQRRPRRVRRREGRPVPAAGGSQQSTRGVPAVVVSQRSPAARCARSRCRANRCAMSTGPATCG